MTSLQAEYGCSDDELEIKLTAYYTERNKKLWHEIVSSDERIRVNDIVA